MTEYSFAAYRNVFDLKAWNCSSCCTLIPGVRNISTFGNPQRDLFGFVATDPDLGTIISFRGTVDLENWLTNLKVAESSPYGNDPKVKVHDGFLSGYLSMKRQIVSLVEGDAKVFVT